MILRLSGVSVRRAGRTILGPLDWQVASGERWVVLGPNGSGKTTLVQVASTYLWPTTGAVEVLGETIGKVDARELRRRIGYAGAGLEAAIDPGLAAIDIVMTARHAALGPWWHKFTAADRDRAASAARRDRRGRRRGPRVRDALDRRAPPRPDRPGADAGPRPADPRRARREPRPRCARDARPGPRAARGRRLAARRSSSSPTTSRRSRPGSAVPSSSAAGGRSRPARSTATLTGPILSEAFGLPIDVARTDGRYRAWLAGDPD